MDSYRGFVFAKMTGGGLPLADHLGDTARSIDDLCDLSPVGEIELTAGWLRHRAGANWKLGHEAALDGYHPRFVHRALISLTPHDVVFSSATESANAFVRSSPNGHGHVRQPDNELLVDRKTVVLTTNDMPVPTMAFLL